MLFDDLPIGAVFRFSKFPEKGPFVKTSSAGCRSTDYKTTFYPNNHPVDLENPRD